MTKAKYIPSEDAEHGKHKAFVPKADYDKAVASLREAKDSLDWYRDVFAGEEHEFSHFWMVELPTQIEDTLIELGELKEQV